MGASPHNHKKVFAPRKSEFRIAAIYWIIGAAWFAVALLWCIRQHSLTSETVAEGAVLPVLFGFLRSESASRRKHGGQVEKKWVARTAAPPDWTVENDMELERVG